MAFVTLIPTRWVGPVRILWDGQDFEQELPLATFESPLWPSVARGARITRLAGGLRCTVISDQMTRSLLLEARHAGEALELVTSLKAHMDDLQAVVATTSRFAKLVALDYQINAKLIYLRLSFATGDAAGHNMVTKASDAIASWIMQSYASYELRYLSVSGNYCSDKKVSAVNGILGRGKHVVAELRISREICEKQLRTSPEAIVELNIKKNLIGSMLAGSLRSANAHFANMLLAFYLATGQDAANIVEGSQGMVHAEVQGDDLYFACTIPNLIIGSVGNGKHYDGIQEVLVKLGCLDDRTPGANAQRLAVLAAASLWCGELSLLAAQTNTGELVRSHMVLERGKQ